MSDIFNRNVSNLAGVFTSDRAKLTMGGEAGQGNLGVLVQQMQLQYAQTITRLYEVGANGPNGASNTYYVGGRTQGQMSLNRVIGPSGSTQAMYAKYGDVCKAKTNLITLTLTETDCSAGTQGKNAKYIAKACVITSVSLGVGAQDMIITEGTQMMFSSLENSK